MTHVNLHKTIGSVSINYPFKLVNLIQQGLKIGNVAQV